MPTRLTQLPSHDIGCACLQVVGPVAVRFAQTRALQIAIVLPGSVDRFLDPRNVADPWATAVNWFAPAGASFDNGQLGIELGYAVTYHLRANQPYRLLLRAEGLLEAEERFTGVGNIRRPSAPPPDWVPPPVPQSGTPELAARSAVAPSEVRPAPVAPPVPPPPPPPPPPLAPAAPPVPIAAPAPAPQTAPSTGLRAFCTQCGTTLKTGATFCTGCGSPADAATAKVSPAVHSPEVSNQVQAPPLPGLASPEAGARPAMNATPASAAGVAARKETGSAKREGSMVGNVVLGIGIALLMIVIVAFADSWIVDSRLQAEAQELQQTAERERLEQEARAEQQRAEEARRELEAQNRARAEELAAEERRAQEQAAEEAAQQQREAQERAAAYRAQQQREAQEQAEMAEAARQRGPAADAQRRAGAAVFVRILFEGERCFEASRFDCAIASANSVLLVNPSDSRALDLRARALDAQRRAVSDVQIR